MTNPYPPQHPQGQRPPSPQGRAPYPPQQGYAAPPAQHHARAQQPHAPQAYAPPPKRRRRWPWVLLGIVLAPLLMFAACTAMVGGAVSQVSGAQATVVYELVGDAKAATTITYSADGSTGISQEAQGALPWRKEVTFNAGALRVASLTAQNGEGAGSLTCRITVDGQVVKEITSTGQYAVVSCASEAF